MKIIKGDLLKMALAGEFDVIVHGCNCQNSFGKGLALTIKNKFPQAYQADLGTTKGDRSKLGTYTSARGVNSLGNSFVIVNAYTQFYYNSKFVTDLFEYDAFQKILDRFVEVHREAGLRWGFPLIGCGLAGGNKERILGMIEKTLDGMDVTVVEFSN